MKILYVNSLYPTPGDRRAIGGAETFAMRLVAGLIENGHEVDIVRSGTTSTPSVERIDDGVDVYSMPCRNVYPVSDGHAHGTPSRLAWHLLEDRGRISPEFQKILMRAQPDLVHTNNVVGLTTDVWRVSREAGIPILHTLHDYYLTCPKVLRYARGGPCGQTCLSCAVLSQHRRKAVRSVDKVIAVSQRMLDIHCQDGLFPETPSQVILNKPPPQRSAAFKLPRPLGPRPVFGYIGRQAPEKGIFELLEAFVTLAPGSAALVIAGTIEPSVRAWVDQNVSQPEDIAFTGFATHEMFFPKIDIAVVPSIWEEPCSMGAGEAFSFGVPVLGSDRGGIPEMLENGRLGWLFTPGTGQLAALMSHLVDHPEEISARAETVRNSVSLESGDPLVALYLDAYADLIHSRHPIGIAPGLAQPHP